MQTILTELRQLRRLSVRAAALALSTIVLGTLGLAAAGALLEPLGRLVADIVLWVGLVALACVSAGVLYRGVYGESVKESLGRGFSRPRPDVRHRVGRRTRGGEP